MSYLVESVNVVRGKPLRQSFSSNDRHEAALKARNMKASAPKAEVTVFQVFGNAVYNVNETGRWVPIKKGWGV